MIEVTHILLTHWDTIGLIITNIVALFMKPPKRKLKHGEA